MADVKITKKMVLEAIVKAAKAGVDFEGVTADDVIAYAETTIAQLDGKAAKAKEKAAEKKAEGDALRDAVKAVLTEEPKTITQIVAEINDPELTNAKVVARLTALVNAGEAFKSDVKVENRKVKAYSTVEIVTAE